MAYENLKSAIKQAIKQNGNQEITGNLLQSTLLNVVNTIGADYKFLGFATPSTVPPTSEEGRLLYFTTGHGDSYVNFPTSASSYITLGYGVYALTREANSKYWRSDAVVPIAQELGTALDKVMSQKAINTELGKKFDKESVVQESGVAEDKVMSQKSVSIKLSDLATNKLNKIYFDNEHKMPFILEAFTKNTDNSYKVEYVSYNNDTYKTSCWLRDKNNTQIVLSGSEIYNKKLIFISKDYSIFIVIDVELIQEDKQSGSFYNIALNSNIYNILNSPFINAFINNKDLKDKIIESRTTKEKFTGLNITKGYLANDGSFQKNDAFFCTDFIELKGTRAVLKHVGFKDYSNSEYKVIHFYNSNKKNIENLFSNEIKGSVNNLTYTNEAKYIRFFTNFNITTDLMSIEFDNYDILDGKILDITNINDFIDIKNILIDWKGGVAESRNMIFGSHGKTSDILKIDRKLDMYVTNPCKQTTPEAYVPYFNKLIFFDENKTKLFKETKYNNRVLNREKIEIPSNARYIQFCFGEEDFNDVHIYIRLQDLIKYNAFKAISIYNRNNEKRISYDGISTPKYIDCCIGLPLSYFVDNLSNQKGYIDSATKSNGTNSYKNNGGIYFRGRKLISYTAIEEKENTVTLYQVDTSNSKLSDEPPYTMNNTQKVVTLRSVARNNGSGQHKSIMILGDSLIDQNISVQYVKELFSQDTDINVSFIGTRGISPALHEGHSGWSCVDFVSNNSPFYIDGTLSVKKYFDKNKERYFNTSSTIDYVIIALGTNDIRQGTKMFNEDECLEIGNNMKKIVDLFLKDYPNAKIAVNLPSTSGLYSAYGCYSFFRMSMIRLRNVYISLFDDGSYNKNVTCVDSGSQISKEYGYDYESLPIDDIVTDEILSGFKGGGGETNIHPNSKGYKQIGKAYYCKIRSWIAGNL